MLIIVEVSLFAMNFKLLIYNEEDEHLKELKKIYNSRVSQILFKIYKSYMVIDPLFNDSYKFKYHRIVFN